MDGAHGTVAARPDLIVGAPRGASATPAPLRGPQRNLPDGAPSENICGPGVQGASDHGYMHPGELFLLDRFELEATGDREYRVWAAEDREPVADVEAWPEQCRVCMFRSGFAFRCDTLGQAGQRIAACQQLGL